MQSKLISGFQVGLEGQPNFTPWDFAGAPNYGTVPHLWYLLIFRALNAGVHVLVPAPAHDSDASRTDSNSRGLLVVARTKRRTTCNVIKVAAVLQSNVGAAGVLILHAHASLAAADAAARPPEAAVGVYILLSLALDHRVASAAVHARALVSTRMPASAQSPHGVVLVVGPVPPLTSGDACTVRGSLHGRANITVPPRE
jgi:hypothetical protein